MPEHVENLLRNGILAFWWPDSASLNECQWKALIEDPLFPAQRNVQSKTCSISWPLLHKLDIKFSEKGLAALIAAVSPEIYTAIKISTNPAVCDF